MGQAVKVCLTEGCDESLEGMRSNAKYHSRACKTKSSDMRRVADGREQKRNLARYEKEAERRRAYASQYLRENAERMRNIRRKRKSLVKYESKLVTDRDWQRLVGRYHGCCAYCGRKTPVLHRDHVIPLARGGRHAIGNLLPACPPCNMSKHTAFVVEWKLRIGGDFTP